MHFIVASESQKTNRRSKNDAVDEAKRWLQDYRCRDCAGKAYVIAHRVVTTHQRYCLRREDLMIRHPRAIWIGGRVAA